MKWIKVALAVVLLVAVSLTITMAGAAPDSSEAPTVQEPAVAVSVDQTETVDEADEVEAPEPDVAPVIIPQMPPDAPADADQAEQIEALKEQVKALEDLALKHENYLQNFRTYPR